ncbi:MAG: nicotinate phosphoribosyltransferase [Longimicrobiales bacterium]
MADRTGSWVNGQNVALLTDQYEFTMMQAYWREGLHDDAVFTLYYRTLPEGRNMLLAAGLDDALSYLETLSFEADHLDYLERQGGFDRAFLDWLADVEFTGSVRAMAEGTPVFPDEPLLEVTGPLPVAQVAETVIMNQVHMQTVLASKAYRVNAAAGDRAVVDFGLRRMHGADAGLKAARAFHIAGVDATSNVLAGNVYGVPVTGTMAHSYIQAHESELGAFRAFTELYPDTVLLVDTYDTLEGVRNVVRLAGERGDDFAVRAVRLDSGDLGELAKRSREILDQAGLHDVEIFASGGLDEYEIDRLLGDGAPIDGFGVGTRMGTSRDAPALDMAYKLTEYAGEGRLKLSSGKRILPGPKQVWRELEDGVAVRDRITTAGEEAPGRPLLEPVMEYGERLDAGRRTLTEVREHAARAVAEMPAAIRGIEPADPYPVEVDEHLERRQTKVAEEVAE